MKNVIFLLLLGMVIGYFVTAHNDILFALTQKYSPVKIPFVEQQVAGVHTIAVPSALQQEIAKLAPADIATASPQMKTIIGLLQKLPKGQVQSVCENVCKGIK